MPIPVPPSGPALRRSARRVRNCLRSSACAALLAVTSLALPAHAVGLGQVVQQSMLGDSLRVVVPVIVGPGEDVAGECVKLAPAQRGGDGIPEVLSGRVALERTAAGSQIVVTSPRAVTDPVVKLTLQVGCDSAVRREYVLLMDLPPPIGAPVAQPAATMAAAGRAAPTPQRAAPGGEAAPVAGASTGAAPQAGTAPPTARRRAAPAGTTARARPSGRGSATARAATPPRPSAVHAARPKLMVSNAAPAAGAAGGGTGSAPARGSSAEATAGENAAALDAEAAALQRRVAELTAMVDRMQQQMRAAEAVQAAQAAKIAEAEAAASSPLAVLGRAWSEGWPLVVAVVAMAALIAALLALRRRRVPAAGARWRMEMPSQGAGSRATTRPAQANTAPQPPIGAAVTANPITAGQAVGTTVDVAELSHVTEEAGVYLAFNRPDRAIDVLREHIQTDARSLPAAWVMLLDLYHAQGREQDFRELAVRFHAQFNAQTPSWDGHRTQAQIDRGLEAFPHLTRKLALIWGRPECREFLDSLLRDNRDGRRSGFSLAAYEDILFLRQLADTAGAMGAFAAAPAGGAPGPLSPPAPSAPVPSAASIVPSAKRPPTLDLELALDEDMLEAGKASSGDAAGSPSASGPKKKP